MNTTRTHKHTSSVSLTTRCSLVAVNQRIEYWDARVQCFDVSAKLMTRKGKKNGKKGRQYYVDADDAGAAKATQQLPPKATTGKTWPVVIMDQSGQRLDQFVSRELGITRSRGALQHHKASAVTTSESHRPPCFRALSVVRAAKAGLVLADGNVAKGSSKLKPGARVEFSEPVRR